jgi:hypothetical protein
VYQYERMPGVIPRVLFALAVCSVGVLPYYRAIQRTIQSVARDNERIAVDMMIDAIRTEPGPVTIVDNCLSGRVTPRAGRFNVEGIYREILKPRLRLVESSADIGPSTPGVVILPLTELPPLAPGWRKIGEAPPFNGRSETVVAITYRHE